MREAELRYKVHQIVDELDSQLLIAIHSLLTKYVKHKGITENIGFDIDGTPRTAEELETILDLEVKRVCEKFTVN